MKNKVLITGGKGDIACAIKKLFENEGFHVEAPGRDELDVRHIDSIDKYLSNFQPDILINNAGYIFPQYISNADIEQTKKQLEINLLGPFLCASIGLNYNPSMKIINIGSAAAVTTHSDWGEYCASKAGLVMATKCWAKSGIYSVCISPGRTKTKMRKFLFPDENQDTLLTPDDFAKVVLKGVKEEFSSGSHIIVRKQNVEDLLKGQEGG